MNKQNPAKRMLDPIDVKWRSDLLELVINACYWSNFANQEETIGYNLEPLNMLELMEDEDKIQ